MIKKLIVSILVLVFFISGLSACESNESTNIQNSDSQRTETEETGLTENTDSESEIPDARIETDASHANYLKELANEFLSAGYYDEELYEMFNTYGLYRKEVAFVLMHMGYFGQELEDALRAAISFSEYDHDTDSDFAIAIQFAKDYFGELAVSNGLEYAAAVAATPTQQYSISRSSLNSDAQGFFQLWLGCKVNKFLGNSNTDPKNISGMMAHGNIVGSLVLDHAFKVIDDYDDRLFLLTGDVKIPSSSRNSSNINYRVVSTVMGANINDYYYYYAGTDAAITLTVQLDYYLNDELADTGYAVIGFRNITNNPSKWCINMAAHILGEYKAKEEASYYENNKLPDEEPPEAIIPETVSAKEKADVAKVINALQELESQFVDFKEDVGKYGYHTIRHRWLPLYFPDQAYPVLIYHFSDITKDKNAAYDEKTDIFEVYIYSDGSYKKSKDIMSNYFNIFSDDNNSVDLKEFFGIEGQNKIVFLETNKYDGHIEEKYILYDIDKDGNAALSDSYRIVDYSSHYINDVEVSSSEYWEKTEWLPVYDTTISEITESLSEKL